MPVAVLEQRLTSFGVFIANFEHKQLIQIVYRAIVSLFNAFVVDFQHYCWLVIAVVAFVLFVSHWKLEKRKAWMTTYQLFTRMDATQRILVANKFTGFNIGCK